jgi:hypothetical protein
MWDGIVQQERDGKVLYSRRKMGRFCTVEGRWKDTVHTLGGKVGRYCTVGGRWVHCGKKHRKFPSQVTDAADHNTPVTENSGIKFPTSLLDCSAKYIGIYFRNIFRNLDKLSLT